MESDDFEKRADRAINTLGKLQDKLASKYNTKSLDDLYEAFNQIDATKLNKAATLYANSYKIVQGTALKVKQSVIEAFSKPFDLAISQVEALTRKLGVFSQASNGWNKYESVLVSTRTMMAATGQSAKEVEKYLDKLTWFTDETSYQYGVMADTMGKFTAKGTGIKDALDMTQGIALWAAQAGQNASTASRVMQQLAQVSGSVKLSDWMSVENANMATAQFMNKAIQYAKQMGTLAENADVNTSNFRETLTKQAWLTTDVLKATLKDYNSYADAVYDDVQKTGRTTAESMQALSKAYAGTMGKQAFEAGQVSKTFTDSIDATADAMSTAWMKIYKSVFGGVEDAETFFTEVSSVLYDIFASPVVDLADTMYSWSNGQWLEQGAEAAEKSVEAYKETLGPIGEFKDLQEGLISVMHGVDNIVQALYNSLGNLVPKFDELSISKFVLSFNEAAKTFERMTGLAGGLEEAIGGTGDQAVETTQEVVEAAKSLDEVANEVIRGDYGNGQERIDQLTALGYSYEAVQNRVNELLGCEFRYEYETSKVDAATGKLITSLQTQEAAASDVAESVDEATDAVDDLDSVIRKLQNGEDIDDSVLKKFADEAGLSVREFKNLYSVGNNIQDTFGGITSLVSLVTYAFNALNKELVQPVLKDVATKIFPQLVAWTGAAGRATTKFVNKVKSFGALEWVFKKIYKFVSLIGDAFAYVLDGIYEASETKDWSKFANHIESIKKAIEWLSEKTFGALGNAIKSATDKMSGFGSIKPINIISKALEYLLKALNAVWDFGKGIFNWFKDTAIPWVASAIKDIVKNVSGIDFKWPTDFEFSDFLSIVNNALKGIVDNGSKVANFIKTKLFTAFDVLAGVNPLTNKFAWLKGIPDIFGNINKWFSGKQGAVDTMKYTLASVGKVLPSTANTIKEFKNAGLDSAASGVHKFADAFSKGFGSISDALGRFDYNKVKEVSKFVASFWILRKSGDIADAVVSALKGVGKAIEGLGKTVVTFNDILKSIKDVFTETKTGIKKTFDSVSDYFTALKKSVLRASMVKLILALSAAIVVLVGAFWLLSNLSYDQIRKGAAAIIVLAAAIGVMALAIGNMSKGSSDAEIIGASLKIVAIISLVAIMATLFKSLSDMPWLAFRSALLKLIAVCALVGAVFWALSVLNTKYSSKDDWQIYVQLVAFGLTVKSLASTMKTLAGIEWPNLLAASIALIGLVGLLNVLQKVGKNFDKNAGLNILLAVLSIYAWAKALEMLTGINYDKIKSKLAEITFVILSFVGTVWLINKASAGMANIGKALMGIAVSVALMAISIKLLGTLSQAEIDKANSAVLAVAVLLVAMGTSLRIASGVTIGEKEKNKLKDISKAFKSISESLIIVVVAIWLLAKLISKYGVETIAWALGAVTAILVALSAAVIAINNLCESAKLDVTARTSIFGMASLILGIVALLVVLTNIPKDKLLQVSAALAVIFTAVGALFYGLGQLNAKATGSIIFGALAVLTMFGAVVAALWFLDKQCGDVDRLKTIAESIAIVTGVVGVLAIAMVKTAKDMGKLEHVGSVIGNVALIEGAFVSIIAVITALMAGVGKLNELSHGGLLSSIEQGTQVLNAVQTAVGENGLLFTLAGALVAIGTVGAKFGLTPGLIAEGAANAAVFATGVDVIIALQGALVGIVGAVANWTGVDDATLERGVEVISFIGESVGALIGALGGAIVGTYDDVKIKANIKTAEDIADDVQGLNDKLSPFINSMKDISTEDVGNSLMKLSDLLQAMASIEKIVFGNDGTEHTYTAADGTQLTTKLTVTEEIRNYLQGWVDAVKGMVTSVQDVNPEQISNLTSILDAVDKVSTAVAKHKIGGFAQAWSGTTDYSGFATGLEKLGPALVTFSSSISGITVLEDGQLDTVDRIVGIMGKVASRTKSLNTLLNGDIDYSEFGEGLGEIGKGIHNFIKYLTFGENGFDASGWDSLTDIPDEAIDKISKICTMASGIDFKSGGIQSWISGEQDLKKFGEQLGGVGAGVADFANAVAGASFDNIDQAIKALNALTENAYAIDVLFDNTAGYTSSGNLESALTDLGNAINTFFGVLDDAGTEAIQDKITTLDGFVTSVSDIFGRLPDIIDTTKTNVTAGAEEVITALVTTLNSDSSMGSVQSAGVKLANKFVSGILSKKSEASSAGGELASSAASGAKSSSARSSMYNAGAYVAEGFAQGMSSHKVISGISSAASAMASVSVTRTTDDLEVCSPSKVFYRIGKFVSQGYANGILKGVSTVAQACSAMVETGNDAAYDAMKDPVMSLATSILDFDGSQPVITPVIDLSNIQNGSKQIKSMFGQGFAFATSANISSNFVDPSVKQNQNMKDAVMDAVINQNSTITVDTPLYLDGRMIAKASAKYTQSELNQINKMTDRRGGKR